MRTEMLFLTKAVVIVLVRGQKKESQPRCSQKHHIAQELVAGIDASQLINVELVIPRLLEPLWGFRVVADQASG